MDDPDAQRPGPEDARRALESIGVARRRAVLEPPQWLHWCLGMCMAVVGLAQLLAGKAQMIVQLLVLVAIFGLCFAAQRRSGMVRPLTRLPRRPLPVWAAFVLIVAGGVLLVNAAARAGSGPLGFFALAVFTVTVSPSLQRLWRRFA